MRNIYAAISNALIALKRQYNLTSIDYTIEYVYQWDADTINALISVNGRQFKFVDSITYGGAFYEMKTVYK